ncbi:MAG: CD1871A family CXXC motif-containing protein [Candidatus Saccharicenans sp.]|nr:CD1871A family CXXC motif-containing protein [Candidatus Saccharicenans sp.]MDH7492536.1 CD1871A family CXXC motif-containing protein [Candidatus Saccharicenans sp.]
MNRRRFWTFFWLGLSVIFILAGLLSGEFRVVWQKAVTVCLECIGIG